MKPSAAVNDGSKIGLMVRSDLSTDSASVGLEVAMGRGIHAHVQPVAGVPLSDQRLSNAVSLLDNSKPAANYLSKPVWLKLVRSVTTWTAYTAADGRAWTPAGVPMGAQIAGAWVGLFVTAHGNGDLVRATFDHVTGLTPDTFVRIGPA